MMDHLGEISLQISRITIPMIIGIGVIGNLINITVLTRATLYKYPCTRYFLMLSINGLAYTTINLIYRLLADGYQIDPATWSQWACKIIIYVTQLCFPMAPYFIVLASFDRYCLSCSNPRIREWSNTKFARKAILLVVVTFAIFYINTPMVVDLRLDDGLGCYNRGDTLYKQVYGVVQCVVFVILAPVLMIFFGLLTIYNTKKAHRVQTQSTRHRRSDRQLLIMLFMQVSSHIILTLPLAIVFTMVVLPTAYRATRFVYFLFSIFFIPYHLSYATPFFLYFLSARIYREESVRLFRKLIRFPRNNRIEASIKTSGILPLVTIAQKKSNRLDESN